MSIGGAVNAALPFLQASAASMQTDTVRIVRNGPLGTPNPSTGVVTPSQSTIYTGPGRVKPYKRVTANGVSAGDAKDSLALYVVSLPLTVTTVQPGDIVHITASADPRLLTTELRVIVVERAQQLTARRLTCELVEARS
jgi:hypothetical protein